MSDDSFFFSFNLVPIFLHGLFSPKRGCGHDLPALQRLMHNTLKKFFELIICRIFWNNLNYFRNGFSFHEIQNFYYVIYFEFIDKVKWSTSWFWMTFSRGSVYMQNRRRPRMEPWGTSQLNLVLKMPRAWEKVLLQRYDCSNLRAAPSSPTQGSGRCRRILRSTVQRRHSSLKDLILGYYLVNNLKKCCFCITCISYTETRLKTVQKHFS